MPRPASALDVLDEVAESIQPQAANARVADAIRQLIVEGRLGAGTQLREATVAASLGVSRNTVREALVTLVDERLAVHRPNRGVFVAEPTRRMVEDLYHLRALVEAAALAWGERLDAASLAEMRLHVEAGRAARTAEDWEGVGRANLRFHRTIASLTGSERVQRTFETNLAEMRLVFHATGDATFHAPYVDDNDRVCSLMETGDRDTAASTLRSYLARAREDLLARL